MGAMFPSSRQLCLLALFALAASTVQGQQTPQPPGANQVSAAKPAGLGTLSNGTYRNPTFGFSYKVSYGWVERTEQMRKDTPPDSKSLLLLAVFERPPEAKGDTVNSAVVFTAEPVSAYPGLETAADYFDPLTEVTTSKGFKVMEEPYEFEVGTKKLVRGDFKKEIGNLSMYQASLVMIQKGYIVSLTFIADSEDELEAMIMDLSFASAKQPARRR
jgi:hypothetical protein